MYKKFFKRLLDFIICLVCAIILTPVWLIIALLIKCTSKGPVFFVQKRLGKGGKPFNIYKFRTMVVGAENMGGGVRVSGENDARITKIGSFLRKTSLDELPQLFNVIGDSMAIVGPRPPVTYHPYNGYENYPEWSLERFDVRPGITGLAQMKVRNGATWDERMKYDVEYARRVTFAGDIKIIFGTALHVLKKDGIYAQPSKQAGQIEQIEQVEQAEQAEQASEQQTR